MSDQGNTCTKRPQTASDRPSTRNVPDPFEYTGESNCNEYLLTSSDSGKIIDAESVIGRDVCCVMCERARTWADVSVCISQWLKALQCHRSPRDISSNATEMRGEIINKLGFILYAWVWAPGPFRNTLFVPFSHLFSEYSHVTQADSFG